jgi:chromosome partitioning protein
VRGLRRGRKAAPPDDQAGKETPRQDPNGTGAVRLVPPAPPPQREEVIDPPPAPAPVKPPAGGGRASHPSGFRETISDVAIAHAELDHVLPPTPTRSVTDPGGRSAARDKASTSTNSTSEAPAPTAQPDTPTRPAEDSLAEVDAEPRSDVRSDPVVSAGPDDSGSEATADAAENDNEDWEPQAASANALPRVLAVANQKGGVGKTTTSVNLGAALAELGFRVLVIDLDPQANATTGLGLDARTFETSMYDVLMRDASLEDSVEPTSMKNLFVAPATIALAGAEIELVPAFSRELKLKKSIEPVIDDFDYVLIDCPPSLGLITVNALAAADEVLVPIQCEYYALEGLSQLMRNVHLVASNLNPHLDISTIVLTMYDARTKLADQVANEVRQHFGSKVCRIVIPRTVRLSEAPSFGQPITTFDPSSRGAVAYRELAKEVSGGTP